MRVVPFDPYTLCDACKVIMYVDVLRTADDGMRGRFVPARERFEDGLLFPIKLCM